MKLRIVFLAICLAFAVSVVSAAETVKGTIKGQVIEVHDGDTFRVWVKHPLWGDMVRKIRLVGVDAPEARQRFGKQSKEAVKRLCLSTPVQIHFTGKKSFDRLLASISLPDGRDLAQVLIFQGLAWHYTKYDKSARLKAAQEAARAGGRGLWAYPQPVPPWEWRRR